MPEPTLTHISGIGPATARALTENGFATVAAVAGATDRELAKVPGFGPARAAIVIAAANSLLSASGAVGSVPATQRVSKKKKKKDKKGKTRGKDKKKDKKGKKKDKKKDKKGKKDKK